MKIIHKQKGSSLIVSLGIMSLLLILSGGIIATIFRSSHLTNNIANSNKAYFAAESGLEEALYEVSNHLSGFEANDSIALTNKSRYDYEIEYRNDGPDSNIPRIGEGNSPIDADWNKIEYKGTYNLNLFYDQSTKGNQTEYDCTLGPCTDIVNPNASSFNLYVRTPDFDGDGDGDYVLAPNETFLTWSLTGLSKTSSDREYTLLPITDSANLNHSEITGDKMNNAPSSVVLNLNTYGEDLEDNESAISTFLANGDLHMPRFKISVASELVDNIGNQIPYLEFKIEADNVILPDSFVTITSEGYAALTKQTIQTKIKQDGALSLFDYAIFQ